MYGCHSAGAEIDPPEGAEVWTLNDCWKSRPDYDRLYELHRLADRPWRDAEHRGHLEDPKGELWMFFTDGFPKARTYPVLEVLSAFPAYFTTSPAWMVAHALLEGVDELWLYGLHFESHHERYNERACMEFWIGYAMGKGVDVHVPARSPLLKGRGLYGLEDSLHNVALSYLPPQPFREGEYLYTGRYDDRPWL